MAADDDLVFVNVTAFDPVVGTGAVVAESNPVPAPEFSFLQLTKSNRKKALPLPLGGDPRAANGFTVSLARVRDGLDENDYAGVFQRGGHIERVRRRKDRKY